MSFRPIAAALLGAVLLGAGSRPAPLIVYSAPAGIRPTGADRIHPTSAVLPNGRIAAPVGTSLFVGANPLGLALSPDGRYAIVANDGGGAPPTLPSLAETLVSGSSLAVVDTQYMRIASVYHDSAAVFFMGVASVTDPSDASHTMVLASDGGTGVVRLYDLDAAGRLTPQPKVIALPLGQNGHAVPAGITISSDKRTAYVADNVGNAVIPIDLATRVALHPIAVGDSPFYVAAGGRSVLATGMGLATYGAVAAPTRQPQFSVPAYDPSKSSTLTVADIAGGAIGDPATVRMDPAPDGTQIVGGAAPGATVVNPAGDLGYVALANVDRIAVVALNQTPRVVRGLDLRLYPGAPYGAEPSAEALSLDGKRLYVALAGLNAIAVLDALRPTRYRYGLVPTAWYPTGLAISRDGRYLYVVAAKGVDGWGVFQRIDLKHTSLVKETLATLRYARTPHVAQFNPVVPPLRSLKRSEAIDHVVYVAVGTQSYDAMLGDLKDSAGAPRGNGDPTLLRYDASITPNLHELARYYALADNFYASDPDRAVTMQFALAGDATLYQQLAGSAGVARSAIDDHGDDPEDYARTGDLFNAFSRAGLTFRDYGGLLRLSGYDGALYHRNTPALAALSDNVDLDFAGWNPKITDVARADEFVRDMQRYVQSDRMPNFTYVWLPTTSDQASVRDADRALGKIVDFISHTPHWSSATIFVVPEGVEASAVDHVNRMRSYALIVSPLARPGYAGAEHLSAASVVKTEEEIFGLPPLTLNDLLASDMASFFTEAPAPQPYQAR